mgnify:CR=1 FL=1
MLFLFIELKFDDFLFINVDCRITFHIFYFTLSDGAQLAD